MHLRIIAIVAFAGAICSPLAAAAEEGSTQGTLIWLAYSETFTDSKKQMEKKIPRQCRKKKGFEALEVE